MILTIFGVVHRARRLRSRTGDRHSVILLLAGASMLIAVTFGASLPFQRYVMPLVPFAVIFSAIGLDELMATMRTA